jgi:hypothetical protein
MPDMSGGRPKFCGSSFSSLRRWSINLLGNRPPCFHNSVSTLFPPGQGESPGGLAQVSGMGGVGKSLLVEEYALRFSAAYPGGLFWLQALGNDANRPTLTTDQQEAVRSDEFRSVATQLGIDVRGLDSRQIEAAIAAKLSINQNSFLWIVDDLASGLGSDAARAWLAPHSLGKTLFTTRSREYDAIGNSIRLDVLEPNEAYELLCRNRKPIEPEDEEAARGIAADLGYHPLALAVCSRALKAKAGLQSFGGFRAALGKQSQDELELAGEFAGVLPSGHEPSVAATLLRSVRSLSTEGVDFLRIASLLATAPIPPSLVASVFPIVDGLDETDADHRAALGFLHTEEASLSEQLPSGARTVHAVISRAIRFSERDMDRRDALSHGITEALNRILPEVGDIRAHQRLGLEVLHARERCNRSIDSVASTILATWVARYDVERGAYTSARELQERVLESARRIFGEEHSATLAFMHNLAITLSHQGDINRARGLEERALELSRRIHGEEHPDTSNYEWNLLTTLVKLGEQSAQREFLKNLRGF